MADPKATPAAASVPAVARLKDGPNPLDYILVLGALVLVGGGLIGLFFQEIDKTLPIIASLLSFLTGTILGGYAGYRWGASQASERSAAPTQ